MYALVSRPTRLDGVKSWSVETVAPRGNINDLKFNPDGSLFAVASDDGSVRLFKQDGSLKRVLIGHETPVLALAWSPDGKQLASASGADRRAVIHIWDPANGNRVEMIEENSVDLPYSLDWHPDGGRLAIGGLPPRIWDLKERRRLQKIKTAYETGSQNTLTWSHDGKLLALAGANGKQIEILDGDTYELLSMLEAGGVQGNCIWSPTERELAFVALAQDSREMQIWAFEDPCEPRRIETASMDQFDGLHSVGKSAWSPDGKTIAIGLNRQPRHTIHLLNGDKVTALTTDRGDGHLGYFDAVSWRNHHLVTASSDGLRIWDTNARELSRHIACFGPTNEQVGFSHDGKIVAVYPLQERRGGGFIDLTSGETSLEVIGARFAWSITERSLLINSAGLLKLYEYDDGTNQLLRNVAIDVSSDVSLSPDDGHLVTRNGVTYSLWSDWRQAKCQRLDLKSAPPMTENPYFDRPLWSKTGGLVATPYNSAVVVWNAATGEEVARYDSTSGPVSGFALSPDGDRGFIVNADGSVKIHASEKSRSFAGHTSRTQARVHWSADGKYVFSAGTNGELIVVDAEQSKTTDRFKIPYPSHAVTHLVLDQIQFSKDGELLMIAGPGMVSFWKSRTGEPKCTVLTDGTILDPTGHYRAGKNASDSFVYVAESTDGHQQVLDAAEFRKRFGWMNAPRKVQSPANAVSGAGEESGEVE